MARHGDPQRPAVAVFLPSSANVAAVIEMPEHAWRKKKDAGEEQAWFYRMYGADASTRAEVRWSRSGEALSYEMRAGSGFVMHCQAKLEDDGVAIDYGIESGSEPMLAAAQAVTCVKLYRPFTDVFLERTYVHLPGGLELIAADSPDRLTQNAEEWLPCRYIARVGRDAPTSPYRSERLDGVTRHFKGRSADIPFLATESEPRGWTACTHTLSAESVFTNPARTCQHADPVVLGITNGKARLRLKVYFVRGSAAMAYERVAQSAAAGRA